MEETQSTQNVQNTGSVPEIMKNDVVVNKDMTSEMAKWINDYVKDKESRKISDNP